MSHGFIENLTQQDISTQIKCDWDCIKKEILGDRNFEHIKAHVGRMAGVKLIAVNLDIDCDDEDEEGVFGSSLILDDCEECANALGISVPSGEEAAYGSLASSLFVKILLFVAEEAGIDPVIIELIKSLFSK